MAQNNIPIGLVCVGNCASSLVQGIHYYANGANDLAGLSHWEMGGYRPADIQVVSAWDIDRRKVGRDVAEAIFAPPNCTARFRSEEHTSERQSLMRLAYAVFCFT